MHSEKKLDSALRELKRLTGLTLFVEDTDPADEESAEEVLEKLRLLAEAYRERYDRPGFLRRLVLGEVKGDELRTLATRFRVPMEGARQVFLIECGENRGGDVLRVLRSMYFARSGDFSVETDERHIALVRSLPSGSTQTAGAGKRRGRSSTLMENGSRSDSSPESAVTGRDLYRVPEEDGRAEETAYTIVDMINTELMLPARVGFGMPVPHIRELGHACAQAGAALEIGRIFMSGQTVIRYDLLGVGRLLYDMPEDSCRMYLREIFGDGGPEDLERELTDIAQAFFENNLNMSETARSLYVHRNTLVYRLEKLRNQTGLDLRKFDDAMKFRLALMVSDILKARQRS